MERDGRLEVADTVAELECWGIARQHEANNGWGMGNGEVRCAQRRSSE